MVGLEPTKGYQPILVYKTRPLAIRVTLAEIIYLYIYGNHLSNSVIAIRVLVLPITPVDQSIDFSRLYRIVGCPTHWRRFNRWSFKPFLIFTQYIRNFRFVNCFSNFFDIEFYQLVVLLSTNTITVVSTRQCQKNKKPSLISG